MRVKYLAQEHNAVPRPGLKPGPPDAESSALTIRPPRLPISILSSIIKERKCVSRDNTNANIATFYFAVSVHPSSVTSRKYN